MLLVRKLLWEQEVGGLCACGAFKSPAIRPAGKSRPDQPSLLNAVKNEGCRAEVKNQMDHN